MLKQQSISFGTDPELFLTRNAKTLASEKVIAEGGLALRAGERAIVVRDGVQVELNPKSGKTIPELAQNIKQSLSLLRNLLNKEDRVYIDWSGTVDVPMDELNSLSPATRQLGCNPSDNYYGAKPINVDPYTFQQRSAGGHIHIGFISKYEYAESIHTACRESVPVADILVGNTCVLLDRDPRAAERRLNYGRAGEFRRPKYGVEYRTLSNFWMRSPVLMDFAFGMMNMAISTYAPRFTGQYAYGDPETPLAKLVGDIEDFRKAIDTNNYNQARANFNRIRPWFEDNLTTPDTNVVFPLNSGNLDKFLTFSEGVMNKGLNYYFPTDPVVAWCDQPHQTFVDFLKGI